MVPDSLVKGSGVLKLSALAADATARDTRRAGRALKCGMKIALRTR
jgi:hypothetical protein